jgi:hypothetical protein
MNDPTLPLDVLYRANRHKREVISQQKSLIRVMGLTLISSVMLNVGLLLHLMLTGGWVR